MNVFASHKDPGIDNNKLGAVMDDLALPASYLSAATESRQIPFGSKRSGPHSLSLSGKWNESLSLVQICQRDTRLTYHSWLYPNITWYGFEHGISVVVATIH